MAAARAADETRANLRLARVACGLLFAQGIGLVWAHSENVGTAPIVRPMAALLDAALLERDEQPAEGWLRLTLAIRLAKDGAQSAAARMVRVINFLFAAFGKGGMPEGLAAGAVVRLRAR